jgi:hypothetical protein
VVAPRPVTAPVARVITSAQPRVATSALPRATAAVKPKRELPWPGIIAGGIGLVVLAAVLLSGGSDNSTATSDTDTPWIELFNGYDLTGWKDAKGAWTVQNGALQAKPNTTLKNSLVSEPTFGDFVLELEYTFSDPKGGSGIYLPAGIQPEIVTTNNLGTIYLGPSMTRPPVLTTPVPPKLNEWATYRVTVRNKQITVAVNGVVISDYDASGILDKPITGPVTLEFGQHFRVRKVRIKKL